MSGRLLIKAVFNGDIRRLAIHNEELTYSELLLLLQRLFRSSLGPTDALTIKYRDDDGDYVTLADDNDLVHAKALSPTLHLLIQRTPRRCCAAACGTLCARVTYPTRCPGGTCDIRRRTRTGAYTSNQGARCSCALPQ